MSAVPESFPLGDATDPCPAVPSGGHDDDFVMVGSGWKPPTAPSGTASAPSRPRLSRKGGLAAAVLILALVAGGCLLAPLMATHDPSEFYLASANHAPDAEFLFGTDYLGRDLFSAIWYGGRASLCVGLLGAAVIAAIGVTYGSLSGMAAAPVDAAMMRAVEILQSVPALLLLLFILSLMGTQNVVSLSLVIGATGWFALARIVRSEVRQIRNSDYILAARRLGAGFPRIMGRYLIPNVVSAVMFVIISSVSASMIMESTLSFLGLGLPVDRPSWGSMLAVADRALLLNTWWVIVIPGLFLVVTLLAITAIGHHFRRACNRGPRNL